LSNVVFEADNGKKFTFGRGGSNYFSMSIGNGMDVTLGLSQGFSQVGQTVQTQSVGGRNIDVTGELYGDIEERKRALSSTCAPVTAGRLVFWNEYFIRVVVKAAPSFSPKKGVGVFKMQFFAPFPYFSTVAEKAYSIGSVTKEFRFPINYSGPHRFGTRSAAKATNVRNDGDVPVAFRLDVKANGNCSNVRVTNLKTLAFLKINGELDPGDQVAVYRDADNAVRAELARDGITSDIIARVDDGSTLFDLEAGENLLAATDDNGGNNLSVQFTFHPAKAVLYET
jgi:hypothetical protein